MVSSRSDRTHDMPLPRLSRWLAIAAGTAATLVVLSAQGLADPVNGERLARRWCAACHLVAADQPQAAADAPSFEAIAKKPDFSRDKLALFLLDPHPKMPNMSLTRREALDLADYIGQLGKR